MPSAQTRPRFKAAPLPIVPSFQCQCGTVHHAADGRLPVGWTQTAGAVFCLDCARAGISSRVIRKSNARSDRLRLRGEVIALLREGQRLMPPGSEPRMAWVARVNALLADVSSSAA